MKHLFGLTLATAFALPFAAQAVTAVDGGWGVYTSAGTASNCPSFCTSGGGGQFARDSDGVEFATSASAQESSYAFGRSLAQLVGPDSLPVLKAEGTASVGKNGSGYAFASQRYSYDGTETLDVEFDYTLTGTVSDGASGYASNFISSSIAVVIGESIPFVTDFGTLIYESIGFGGEVVAGTDFLSINDPSQSMATGSIEYTLDPGDTFYIVTTLTASAKNGTADAFSTLVSQFLDPTTGAAFAASNFTAASAGGTTAVPLPAAAWMLIAAMGGLTAASRRRAA